MFRRDFQLSGNVILHQFPKKSVIFIIHQIIVADSRTNKHFFYARQHPQFTQNAQIILMRYLQVSAWLGMQAFLCGTGSPAQLIFAGRVIKIRSRTADIMNIAFEIRILRNFDRFFYNRLFASRRDYPALMIGQRTEGAAAETAAVGNDRKADFINRRNVMIHRMKGALIRKRISKIHLFLSQGESWSIRNDIPAGIRFDQNRSLDRINVEMLKAEAFSIFSFILSHFLKGRQPFVFKQMIDGFAFIDRSLNPDNILNGQSAVQRLSQLNN